MASDSNKQAHEGLTITVERPDDTTARVTFEVTKSEFEKLRDQGLRNASKQTSMKGFRPGKTPRKVVEKTHGEHVEKQCIEHFMNHVYQDAIKEHELQPAAHPSVDMDELKRGDDGTLSHTFDVLLRPDLKLGQYKGLKVQAESVAVTEEELETTLAQLRQQHARPEEAAADEQLLEDGMAVCKVIFTTDGVDEPVLDRDGVRLSPSAPPTGIDPESYKEKMIGGKVGDSFEVSMEYPDQFPIESARGTTGNCKIELTEVFRIVEPDEAELARVLGMEDSEDFLGDVRSRMAEAKQEQEDRRLEADIIEQLVAAHPMEIPPALVENQANAKVKELRENLPEGLDEAEIEARLTQERNEAVQQSSHAMRALYIIEAIAKEEEVQVQNDDIKAELTLIASRNGAPVEDVRKYYQEQNLGQQLVMELLERKVRKLLLESAELQPAS